MEESEWLASEDAAAMLEHAMQGRRCDNSLYCPSDRKLRLFAVACCRAVWDGAPCRLCGGRGSIERPVICGGDTSEEEMRRIADEAGGDIPCPSCHGTGRTGDLTDPRSRRAVEVAELYADDLVTGDELDAASQEATDAVRGHENTPLYAAAWVADRRRFLLAAERARSQNGPQYDRKAGAAQAALLREIVGNPFRAVTLPKGRERTCSCEMYGRNGWVVNLKGRWEKCDRCKGSGKIAEPGPWLTPTVLDLARTAYGYGPCGRCKGRKYISHRTPDDSGFGRATRTDPCPDCRGTGTALGPFRPEALPILADALEDAGCTDADILAHLRRPWVVRYAFAGATGKWGQFPTAAEAERAAAACREHFHGLAQVAVEGPGHVRGCHVVDLLLNKS